MPEDIPQKLKNTSVRLSDHDVYMLDPKGVILSWNSSAEQSFDTLSGSVLGKSFAIFYMPEDQAKGLPQKNMQTAAMKGYMEEEGWRYRNGKKIWAVASITALYDEHGALKGFVKIIRDKSENKLEQEDIIHRAFYDHLTDLPNRNLFEDRLNFLISRAKRKGERLGVMFLDLDFFKNINDSLGHKTGDLVLKEVGKRLVESVREVDTVARFGGDEFMILLNDIHASDDCIVVAEKIIANLKKVFKINNYNLYLTGSMGIAIYPYDGADVETLIKNADTALYRVKESARSNFGFYSQTMSIKIAKKIGFENRLAEALEKGEMILYYQPIIDIKTNSVVSAEALVRWHHPQLGFLLPNEFIPIIEDSELFFDFCCWSVETACKQNKKWQEQGMPPIRVAVNISVRQLSHANFVKTVKKALDDSGLDPQYLELEITETAAMQNIEQNFKILKALKDYGIHISIDDFGIGHSSLSYLKNFPIDTIKIDQTFVKEGLEKKEDLAIIKAILTLAEGLKLDVVAEGIEHESQLHILSSLGCNKVQGFLFGMAIPEDTFFENYRNNFLI